MMRSNKNNKINPVGEKAFVGNCGYNNKDSLEEKISAFLLEDNFDESEDISSFEDEFDEEDSTLQDPLDRAVYWESQESLLQEVLEHHSMTGPKFRKEISKIICLAKDTDYCNCLKPNSEGCTNCLRERVVNLLCKKGFNATLCTSKWKNTKKFPGGKHEYIEVIASTSGRKKQIPYLIELEFREQFQIAKACNEYQKLVALLPEYYIGKADCLDAIVRLLCDSAKKSMKEKKIYMGPWRKRSFMQMKWFNSLERKLVDESAASSKLSLLSSEQAAETRLQLSAAPAVVVT